MSSADLGIAIPRRDHLRAMAAPQETKAREVSLEEEDEFEEFEVEGEHCMAGLVQPGASCVITFQVSAGAWARRCQPPSPVHFCADWDARQEDPQKEELWEQVRLLVAGPRPGRLPPPAAGAAAHLLFQLHPSVLDHAGLG